MQNRPPQPTTDTPRALSTPPLTNMVSMDDAFIGRELELAQLSELLEAGHRWVTICGEPGVGKSRLAREACAHKRQRELRWVDLRAVASGHLLRTLGEALGLMSSPDEPQDSLTRRVLDALCARDLLLVLDDADHLSPELAALDDALPDQSAAQLLVTSRPACLIPGAQILSLKPLPSETPQDPAMTLLRSRLAEARIGRAWDNAAWESCAAICRALDGTPLAIEIAAARMALLPPARLLERIQAATSGAASPPTSLHATVALSWDMLEPWAKATLAQCAVCEPGFGAELIELCEPAAPWPDAPTTLDILDQLRSLALLRFEDDGAQQRGDMPPTVRMYALEQLRREASELEAARLRHLRACAVLAWRANAAARGHRFAPAITELIAQLPNLRRAAALADDAPLDLHVPLWLGLGLALWRVGDLLALRDGMTALRARMERAEPGELPAAQLCAAWRLCSDLGAVNWERAGRIAFLERALTHAATTPEQLALTLDLAEACSDQYKREQADAYLEQARLLLKRAPDMAAEAHLRFIEGYQIMRTNQLREAHASMRESTLLASQTGALHLRARALTNLSFICHALGMIEEMTAALREAHDTFEEIGDVIARCHVLRMLAWNAVDDQRPLVARAAIDELLAIGQRQMIGWVSGIAYMLRGHLAFEEQRIADALTDYERALINLQGGDHLAIHVGVTLYISLALEHDDQLLAARARFDDAFARLDGLRAPWARAYLRCNRAVWALRDQDRTTAERQLAMARDELADSDGPLHKSMIQLYMCVMDTLEWELAQRAGKARLERQHLKQLLDRLGGFMSAARPMLGRSLELRIALRHIQRRLPSWLRARLELEIEDPACRALLLDVDLPAYRGPDQNAWIDMSKRPTPMRLLLALAKHHADCPGEPMSADALCEQVWPGERILPDAAANRLYVTIAGLRKEGLRETILNIEGGYILPQELRLLRTRSH